MKKIMLRTIQVSLVLAAVLSFFVCRDTMTDPGNKPDEPETTTGGYVHASGILIHDGEGKNLILKGVGIGGWMLQEGYMLGTSGPQHEIRTYLESLAGKDAADKFYEDWLAYFIAEKDIDQIAAWGYNSIRLPMHYNLFFDENHQWIENQNKGIELTDNLLRWCEKNRIYLILDLHAAPGAQGEVVDIVDKKEGESLWRDEKYQDMTVVFWQKIAERYADKKWIAGYDLLNEPNYDFENSGNSRGCNCKKNEPLTALYKRIINTIRTVDKNHLIILEGNCMGGNYAGMDELATYDPQRNLALSFHGYWGPNTQADLQGKLDLRTKWRVPLWRGEIGENSNTWFTDMVVLCDKNQIGWANWPWKKINNLDGPVIIRPIAEWDKVIAYFKDKSKPKPSAKETQTAMTKMIENISLENCRLMHDYSYAWIDSPLGKGAKPFAEHILPGVIHFTDYDLGKLGESWSDTDYQNTSGSSTNTAWNRGLQYRNDGVDIWKSTNDNSSLSNGYYVGEIKDGEWLQFTLNQATNGTYKINLRFRSKVSGKMTLYADGQKVLETNISNTSNAWKTELLGSLHLPSATKIKVVFDQGGYDLSFMQLTE
ncbi:MAG: cellulase family glycosylhydrolase [Candidatus Symbiothrix sp.]|nr:cellulase family glycosylhydrolase [Candidatus Symbiothrix sp.]